jgi:hypothetical protein
MTTPIKSIAAVATAAVLAAGGISLAADTATEISVERAATIFPGTKAPFDAAGVKAIRKGKVIPKGYRLEGIKVTNTRGNSGAGASLYFKCAQGRLRTFGETGGIGLAIDRTYVGHLSTWVRTYPGRKKGVAESGTVYAVCG